MSTKRPPILLVEDSEDDAELATLTFQQCGMSAPIVVVRDGEEALDYLFGDNVTSKQRIPFLVLLDISLPKIDGFEVLRRIRSNEETRRLPTVMFSSSNVPEDVERAYDIGANSYVRKPVEFSRYSDTLRQVGQYWINLNEVVKGDFKGEE